MTHPSLACWWQAESHTLDLRSRAGAWRVRLWPDPAVLAAVGPASAAAPPLHLLLADAPVVSTELVDLVVAARTVPAPVRRCVASCIPAAEQLLGLQLLHAVPEAQPLLRAVPALGRALISAWTLGTDQAGLAVALQAHQGRAQTRALLRWLRLPDSGAMLKAVSKVADPTRWTLHDLSQLAAWLAAEPKTVQHLPRLHSAQLRVWQHARRAGVADALRVGVYRGLAEGAGDRGLETLPDALAHLARAGASDRRLLRPIDSPLDLAQRLFAALAETRAQGAARRVAVPGSPVPTPMSVPDWIEPLATPAALTAEGGHMRHCAGREEYRVALLGGCGYGFAIHHPAGRATAWVTATGQAGVVRLTDLQAAEDAEPDPAVRSAVAAWADAHNAWATHTLHGGPLPASPPVPVPEAAAGFVIREPADLRTLTTALLALSSPDALDAESALDAAAAEPADSIGAVDLEAALHRNVWHLVEDIQRLRDSLVEIVGQWRDVPAPTEAEQDAIAVDFARICHLLVRTLSREREALAEALDSDDAPGFASDLE